MRLIACAPVLCLVAACGHGSSQPSAGPPDAGISSDAGGSGGAGGSDAGATSDAGTSSDAGTDATGCPVFVPVTPPANQIFVSPTGLDTAAGTAAAPLLSLGAAAKRLPSGGTIVVLDGQYGPQTLAAAGTASTPLVIQAAPGAKPLFDGSSITTNYGAVLHLTSVAHLVLQGLEIANGTGPNVTGVASDKPVTDLTIVSCSIHDMNGTLARFAGDGITFANNDLYNGALVNQGNPAMFKTGGWPTCMGTAPDTSNPASPWPTNVTIRGNHVHDCWGEGIGIWFGAGVTVEDNVVERAFNVGVYLDNASTVTVARNFVSMTKGMAANGGTGRGVLLGVEPYPSFNPTVQSDHDITVQNNVIVANGIGWWTSSSTSPNNTYASVKILHNTILDSSGGGIGFSAVGTGATSPSGCAVTDNVFSESGSSYVGDASAFAFSGNAWLNEKLPAVAGSTDVSETIAVPTVIAATDAQPLAAMVGQGVASGVPADFLCQPRSASAPTRGAFER